VIRKAVWTISNEPELLEGIKGGGGGVGEGPRRAALRVDGRGNGIDMKVSFFIEERDGKWI